MRHLRVVLGLLVLIALVIGPWFCLQQPADGARRSTLLPSLWQYWTGRRHTLQMRFPQPTDVAVGDPIFIPNGGPEHLISLEQVGEIQALFHEGKLFEQERGWVTEVRALLYSTAPPSRRACASRTAPSRRPWPG